MQVHWEIWGTGCWIHMHARSEYNSVFLGEGTGGGKADETTKLPFFKALQQRNTLTGTPSDCHFTISSRGGEEMVSTHRGTFKGEALQTSTLAPESVRRQRQRITCIPQGDRSKVAVLCTNHQASYNAPPHQLQAKPAGVSRHINQSSIKLKDHTKPPTEYFTTTATQTFTQPDSVERVSPLVRFSRNASFFPTGDLDPARVKERLNHATTKSAHPQPPAGSFPAHINSCNFHTESSVHLRWSKNWLHPSGTMAASYQPVSKMPHRAKAPSTDNLPLHYFSSVTSSTTADSYRRAGGDKGQKMKINVEAINNLKSLHWSLPDMRGSTYCTTHRDDYTALPQLQTHMG